MKERIEEYVKGNFFINDNDCDFDLINTCTFSFFVFLTIF